MLKFHGAKIHTIGERFTKEDIQNLKFQNLKIIIYSNPSNPTGYVMTKEQKIKVVGQS